MGLDVLNHAMINVLVSLEAGDIVDGRALFGSVDAMVCAAGVWARQCAESGWWDVDRATSCRVANGDGLEPRRTKNGEFALPNTKSRDSLKSAWRGGFDRGGSRTSDFMVTTTTVMCNYSCGTCRGQGCRGTTRTTFTMSGRPKGGRRCRGMRASAGVM